MAELLYQGHGSYRIVSNEGVVIYVDPYAGEGYDMPADIVIVTHEHSDHNQVDLVTLKDDGVILRHGDLFVDGEYPIKKIKKVMIEGTPAENKNHTREECVGFIMTVDGITLYGAGDTNGSLTVVSIFSLTKSLKMLIISILLSFFIVKFAKFYVVLCRII